MTDTEEPGMWRGNLGPTAAEIADHEREQHRRENTCKSCGLHVEECNEFGCPVPLLTGVEKMPETVLAEMDQMIADGNYAKALGWAQGYLRRLRVVRRAA